MPQGPADLGPLNIDTSAAPTLTFSWLPCAGVAHYQLQGCGADDFPNLTHPAYAQVGPGVTSVTLHFAGAGNPPWAAGHANQQFSILPPGTYKFVVYAIGSEGGGVVGISQEGTLTIASPSPFPYADYWTHSGVLHYTANFKAWYDANQAAVGGPSFASRYPGAIQVD